jgi:hypothetical protein
MFSTISIATTRESSSLITKIVYLVKVIIYAIQNNHFFDSSLFNSHTGGEESNAVTKSIKKSFLIMLSLSLLSLVAIHNESDLTFGVCSLRLCNCKTRFAALYSFKHNCSEEKPSLLSLEFHRIRNDVQKEVSLYCSDCLECDCSVHFPGDLLKQLNAHYFSHVLPLIENQEYAVLPAVEKAERFLLEAGCNPRLFYLLPSSLRNFLDFDHYEFHVQCETSCAKSLPCEFDGSGFTTVKVSEQILQQASAVLLASIVILKSHLLRISSHYVLSKSLLKRGFARGRWIDDLLYFYAGYCVKNRTTPAQKHLYTFSLNDREVFNEFLSLNHINEQLMPCLHETSGKIEWLCSSHLLSPRHTMVISEGETNYFTGYKNKVVNQSPMPPLKIVLQKENELKEQEMKAETNKVNDFSDWTMITPPENNKVKRSVLQIRLSKKKVLRRQTNNVLRLPCLLNSLPLLNLFQEISQSQFLNSVVFVYFARIGLDSCTAIRFGAYLSNQICQSATNFKECVISSCELFFTQIHPIDSNEFKTLLAMLLPCLNDIALQLVRWNDKPSVNAYLLDLLRSDPVLFLRIREDCLKSVAAVVEPTPIPVKNSLQFFQLWTQVFQFVFFLESLDLNKSKSVKCWNLFQNLLQVLQNEILQSYLETVDLVSSSSFSSQSKTTKKIPLLLF